MKWKQDSKDITDSLNLLSQGTRPDKKRARACDYEHSRKQIHIHQSGGTINGAIINDGAVTIS